ncbi:MAG: hypothetical protein Ct9H90mP24_2810 [Methanobacteriota archaeon]|nr:MAG: hypothetical protein Ct9H90mP24_2810 [Euryarchaeota archaeon]
MPLTWPRESVGGILTFVLEQVEETRTIVINMAEQGENRSILIPLLLLFLVYNLGAPGFGFGSSSRNLVFGFVVRRVGRPPGQDGCN